MVQVAGGTTATLDGLTITGGSDVLGGGVDNLGTLTMNNCSVTGNVTTGEITRGYDLIAIAAGGGIDNNGTLNLYGCTMSGNTSNSGGGLYNQGDATLDDCTITGNTADSGGGIKNSGLFALSLNSTMTVDDCTVTGNSAASGGGIFAYSGGTTTVDDCTVTGNSAASSGGGIAASSLIGFKGGTTVDDCAVTGNSAGTGGGIFANGSALTMTDDTVAADVADVSGGGIAVMDQSRTTMTDSTVVDCTTSLTGGGVFNSGATLTLTSVTVADNQAGAAGDGGGIFAQNDILTGRRGTTTKVPPTTTLTDTIVSTNTAGSPAAPDNLDGVAPTAASAGDLVGSGGVSLDATTNLVGIDDPLLGALGNYGGPTETMALLPGSPAIDAGRPAPPSRPPTSAAWARIGTVDIGSFESQGFIFTPVVGSTPQSTLVGTAFASPLAVTVTAKNPGEPVAGGVVTLRRPAGGRRHSATLGGITATIDANGQASATATADIIAGGYDVAATAAGVGSPANFVLTNTAASLTGFSVSWGKSGSAALKLPAVSGGLILPAGRKTDLPWLGIDQFTLTLNAAVPLSASDVSAYGVVGGNYGPATISPGPGNTYTIALAKAITKADRVTVTIGNASISSFSGELSVLPGDVNDDGVVNVRDLLTVGLSGSACCRRRSSATSPATAA